MRLLSLVVLSSLSIGCVPSSPKTSSGSISEISAAEKIAKYESLYKTAAMSFEDSASFKINPCRDTASNLVQVGNDGTFDLDGHSFDYNFSSGVNIVGDCQIDLNPSIVAYRRAIKIFNPSASIDESGDYTVIYLLKNSGMTLYGESGQAPIFTVSNTESAFLSEVLVREVADTFSYLYLNRYMATGNYDNHQVVSAMTFDRANSVVETSIVSDRLGRLNSVSTLNPSAVSNDVGDIKNFRIQEMQLSLTGDEQQGLYYFAVYPSVLTAQEKVDATCYAMYIMAKAGNTELLMQHLDHCGL